MDDKSWLNIAAEFLINNFWALAGALLSLFMVQKVSVWRGLLSFAVGFSVAVIVPNVVSDFYAIGESTKSGIAFAAGMLGMNVMLGLTRLATQFRNDPSSIGADIFKILRGQYKTKTDDKEDKE